MDFTVLGSLSGHEVVGVTKDVIAGVVGSIVAGDLVVPDDGNAGYVRLGANGDTSTIALRTYVAVSTSTDTVAADGTVELVWAPNMVLQGTATTPANLIQAVIDTKVTLDVAAGVQTIDENDTTTGFMRIMRPLGTNGSAGGVGDFETTSGVMQVIVNEWIS